MSQKSKTNDQIILETIIQDKCNENNDELSYSEYFEIYSACEILKNHDLTYDDILCGIVGNGGDGGIDSIYTFVNGEQLKEDTLINTNTKKNQIELVIIQSKTSPNFKEEAIVKFRETAEDLFNLANKPEDYAGRYNKDLIDCVNIFRAAYSKLARTLPKILVRYFYVTQGTEVHVNVDGKVEKLKEDIQNLFNGSEFTFEFITASKLLAMTRDIPSTTRMLEVAESPIGTTSGSYLCLVNLYKYFEFICDNGNLARSIFESNVRDYQGSVIVNTGIRKTLENLASENFWYLNNGVTIITPKAVLAGKQLTIEDPQIVNGLQTSNEIYLHYSKDDVEKNDPRSVLVRVICEENEEARDRIIRATNSQTAIPPASLRSSDEIHRNIEDFLKNNDFYYDRKKNYYKNQGKSPSRIVSIPYMAQAMMAIILKKPDSARARPSTLINSDNEYKEIFSLAFPIDVYLKCIQIVKAVESYLKPDVCQKNIERKVITNIKYYVSMVVAIKLLDSKENMLNKLHELPSINISTELLSDATETVLKAYEELGATDQVAKGTKLVKILLS